MDYSDYEVEDFLLDAGFINYCLERRGEDVVFWQQWIRLHPDRYEVVRQAKQLYFVLNGMHTASDFRRDKADFQASVDAYMAGDDGVAAGTRLADGVAARAAGETGTVLTIRRSFRRRVIYVASAAAVIVLMAGLVLILSAGWRWNRTWPLASLHTRRPAAPVVRPDSYTEISNPGERKSFQLPDGTKVMLNAGSRIGIRGDFYGKTREITLEGEAFFDVAKEAGKPFIIHTDLMDIKVLGTSVNVKAYPEDRFAETSLINGSVEVMVKVAGSRQVLLHPNEKIIIPHPAGTAGVDGAAGADGDNVAAGSGGGENTVTIQKLTINPAGGPATEISWTQNCLAFNDNSLGEIAVELERWYSVSIQFEDDSVKQFRYTATFDKKTIGQVLNALAMSRPFDYRWTGGNTITIKNAKMKN